MRKAGTQIRAEYSLFGKALSDLFGILTEIGDRMNNNPVRLDNVEDAKRVSRDEQTTISATIKSPDKRKPFEMLKPEFYILQERRALSLDGALPPSCTPLEDPALQREERRPPLTPTEQDLCLRLFPGDDFIRILPILFKTPIEFVQLLLRDGNFVGIGR